MCSCYHSFPSVCPQRILLELYFLTTKQAYPVLKTSVGDEPYWVTVYDFSALEKERERKKIQFLYKVTFFMVIRRPAGRKLSEEEPVFN